jgi:phage tail sheath protein FI
MPFNNGSSTSAGVYTGERDNSIRATAVSTSVGAIVGAAHRGPVGVPTLCIDEDDFVTKFGKSDEALSYMSYCARAFLLESNQLYVTRVAPTAVLGGVKVSTINNFSETVALTSGYDDPEDITFASSDIMVIHAENPGDWNNDLSVLLYPDTDDLTGEGFVLNVFEGASNVAVEVFRGTLHDKVDGHGRQLSIETQTEENSSRIRIAVNHLHPSLVVNPKAPLINALTTGSFTFGSNGDAPTISDIAEAWDLYEDREELSVNLLINAGYTDTTVQLRMLEIAEDRDDCFAVLDVPSSEQETQKAIDWRRNTLNVSSSRGACYAPDLLVRDTDEGRSLYVPPSGHVAGVFARTDRVTAAWFAPAGVNRGQLNVLGVREVYKQGHRDAFDQNQINPIRVMSGAGIVLWGAQTLQSFASALSNVNVARLLMLLKTSISDTANTGVFEPNDEFLRIQLRAIAENILNPIQRGRGLYGFEVICDDRNNTSDTIASGDVILDVYIDPVIPAKRIHLNAVIPKTGQIKFAQELIYN